MEFSGGKATILSDSFNMCLSVTEISKKTENLNHLIDQFDQRDKHSTLHPTSTEYTLLSEAHGILTEGAQIPNHKASSNKGERTELSQGMFPAMVELYLSDREITSPNVWKLTAT